MKVILQLILLCVVLPYSSINAQKKAVVLDAQSGEPIPFVNIQIKGERIGTTTNVNGEYQLKTQADKQIVFSAVGYNTLCIQADSICEVTQLFANRIELSEILVFAQKRRELKVGKLKQKLTHHYFGNYDNSPNIVAILHPFKDSYNETPFIKNISFLTRSDIKDATFNIRLYNSKDNKPGNLICNQNLIGVARKGKRITTIQLDSLNLTFPETGLFVAIEWLHIESNRYDYIYTLNDSKKKLNGTSIEPSFSCLNNDDRKINAFLFMGEWLKDPAPLSLAVQTEIVLTN